MLNRTPTALAIDGLILLIYFFGIVGFGLWAGRRNRNLTEFALGGRSVPWWAVLASIIAAETSAATFLGTPAEGFKTRSFIYAQLAIGTILARIIVAFTFIKPYYHYRVQSIYEFLNIRFGPWTRNLASSIFLFTRVLGIGVRLYLGGVILKVIWQYLFPAAEVNIWIYFWGILFVTLLTTFYTAIGGIKAVVWTDFIQASLMMGSIGFTIWLLISQLPAGLTTIYDKLGSWPVVFQTGLDVRQGWWLGIRQMLEQPYTLFAAFIGSTFQTMATHGTDQDNVQRMLTAKDSRRSQLSLILSGFADLPVAFGFLLVGILLFVHYQITPDPRLPEADNEIFAHYIVTQMPTGMRGLIIAGLFATMMGSTSAALNAMATSFTKDFVQPYFGRSMSDGAAVYAARAATVGFGVLMIGIATITAYAVLRDSKLTIIPLALQSAGYAYGSLLGVFLLGMLTKRRGHDRANVAGMLAGIVAVLTLCKVQVPAFDLAKLVRYGQLSPQDWSFGGFLPDWWPAVAWPWWILTGCCVCVLVSCLFPTPRERVEIAEKRAGWRGDQVESGLNSEVPERQA